MKLDDSPFSDDMTIIYDFTHNVYIKNSFKACLSYRQSIILRIMYANCCYICSLKHNEFKLRIYGQ